MKEHDESYYAFKPLRDNPIILDFSGCRYIAEVHIILKECFGLPEYYGENWAALWDCLRYLFHNRGNWLVEIRGLTALPKDIREGCAPMLKVFRDVNQETPNVVFRVMS